MNEIAIYKGQSPIDYIVNGNGPANIPMTFGMRGDTLGLAEHGHVRAALATETYYRFDAVCGDIIIADPATRDDYLSGPELVNVGTIRVGQLHVFSVHRHEQTDGAQYTVLRTDIGTKTGGFTITRKDTGAIMLTHNGELRALDEDSDEYVEALGQVSRFLEVLAEAHNLPIPTIGAIETNEEFRARAKRLQKEENSLKNKALGAARPVAKLAVKAVTSEGQLGERKLSYKKIAAIALLMVVPGYSGRLIDAAPIPRPASFELASSAAHALLDAEPPTAEQAAEAEFRASNTNLPDSAYITELGTSEDIALVPDVGTATATYADESTVYVGQKSTVINGLAPVRVSIKGKLSAGDCAVLGIDPAAQTGNYAVAGLTQQAIKDLQVSASREELSICNVSSGSIFTDNTVLYVDAK